MLGHGKAADLPAIPGRGIWQYGNEELIVQVPFLDKSVLTARLEGIKSQYANGERKKRHPMLLEDQKAAPFWLDAQQQVALEADAE